MTKAELIHVIIELKDYTYTHDELMRMTKKQLIDHFYRLADPTRHKEGGLDMTRAEELASVAAYGWQSDDDGNLSLEMFPEPFKRGFLKGYESAEKDLGWHPATEHPPVDEEVIVLTDDLNTAPIYKIALGHIVDRMHCSDYNGWNIPGVCWWMPMPKIPKEDEK